MYERYFDTNKASSPIDRSWNYVRWDLDDVTHIWNVIVSENSFSVVSRETCITKAAPSVVTERVDCWLPHRPPANIAHHDHLSTLISHCGCAIIFQDSLWNLRKVIRSGRPCFPLKKWLYGIPCGQRHLLCHPITLWKNLHLTINPMKAVLPQRSELILRKVFQE
jgi:hypothetical protein